jgi:hypothetical protein
LRDGSPTNLRRGIGDACAGAERGLHRKYHSFIAGASIPHQSGGTDQSLDITTVCSPVHLYLAASLPMERY